MKNTHTHRFIYLVLALFLSKANLYATTNDQAFISGSAVEDESVAMQMVTGLDGAATNAFEIYTTLTGEGTLSISRHYDDGTTLSYGMGASDGLLAVDGEPIATTIEGAARISVDFENEYYTILPITSMCIVGSSTYTGDDVTKGMSLDYLGKGVWGAQLTLNSGTSATFQFILNQDEDESIKRITGTNGVVAQSVASQYNISVEEIATNMNGGDFYVEVDMQAYTYLVSGGEQDPLKISIMGSSVASGTGATDDYGYAAMYSDLLEQRNKQGTGLAWTTSNISIGGNTTALLLDRWERDLLSNTSSYVIYGLSLGNEGVHETGIVAYNSYIEGMQQAISLAEEAGIVPVVANNYTRGDYDETDYNYVKQLNLLIHEWDVPSINTLGAIDDGNGQWASGFENDSYHPNSAGHEQFLYAMVPSLFDALKAGKPLPQRVTDTSMELGRVTTSRQVVWYPEEKMTSFTFSVDISTTESGTIAWLENESSNAFIHINADGTVSYESPFGRSITSATTVNSGEWQRITLTHYYAWGNTTLYINDEKVGDLPEKLTPKAIALGSNQAPSQIAYRELFGWRSGMNAEEIAYVSQGKMLKSSLEIYAPLGGDDPLENLAQSTNELSFVNEALAVENVIYIDFGKDDGSNGNITEIDEQGNFWNNVVEKSADTEYTLVNAYNQPVAFTLQLTSDFLSNGILNGGLLSPDANLLGDFAVATATQDYFFIEENNGAEIGTMEINNLSLDKAYRFHIFGSRSDTSNRIAEISFTGTNSYEATHQMSGANIGVGSASNQNDSEIYVSEAIYPDANGTIKMEMERVEGKFAHINIMKIEECDVAYPSGSSPIISVTPSDEIGVRIAKIHSSIGSFTGEEPENMLLDKNVSGNGSKKWCYNGSDPFVIIELSDYYDVDKFVIEDCTTRESQVNLSEYTIYVSTTGTADADWQQVVHQVDQADIMYKIDEITPTKARYIKLVPLSSTNVIRIYGFQIYGRKSFDSIHDSNLISVGKPVVMQQSSTTSVHQAAVTLFDGDTTSDNSKWATSGVNDSYLVVDLEAEYALDSFKLYDAASVDTSSKNITGYTISTSTDMQQWEVVVDATNKSAESIKEETLATPQVARYVKLEIPADRMGEATSLALYEFSVFGSLNTTPSDASLAKLQIDGVALTPLFSAEQKQYTLTLSKETELITIRAEATNPQATISGDTGEQILATGENRFTINVLSEDSSVESYYNVIVSRDATSSSAALESLSIEGIDTDFTFSPATYTYRMETIATTVTISGQATTESAMIEGVGVYELADGLNEMLVTVTSEDGINSVTYTLFIYNTTRLLSVAPSDGTGKRIVNIESYSGMASTSEHPYNLFLGWEQNLSGDTSMKWCDNTSESYVVFTLPNIYTIDHIEFRDCQMIESGWPNITAYTIYVSTTDTDEDSWIEVVNETGVGSINEKVISFDPVDARFIKFVPTKGGTALRIYGFDIYGEFKEEIERNGVVSVGKTILACTAGNSNMVTAANALDGRDHTFWQFARQDVTLEIDLEAAYTIDTFVIKDSMECISGYQIAISDDATTWQSVLDTTYVDQTGTSKVAVLDSPVTSRYVQLFIPYYSIRGTTYMTEFEVYEAKEESTGVNENTLSKKSTSTLTLAPNPVAQGAKVFLNNVGDVRIYSSTGEFLTQFTLTSTEQTISTQQLSTGIYIVHLENNGEVEIGKLIVY